MILSSCILGIAPAATGVLAFYFQGDGTLTLEAMPDDDAAFGQRLAQMQPDRAVIEIAPPWPAAAMVAVCAAGIRVRIVAPAEWRRHFGLAPDSGGEIEVAARLWPEHARHFASHGGRSRATAALLARHAADRLGGGAR